MISPLQAVGLAGAAPIALRAAGNLLGGLSFFEQLRGETSQASAPQFNASNQPSAFGIEQIESDFQQQLDAFAEMVRQRLSDAGLPDDGAIEITAGDDGQITVEGSGQAAESIKSLLASDAELVASANALAAEHRLLTAAQRHLQFAEQYLQGRINPANLNATGDDDSFRVRVEADSVAVASH